MILDAVVEDPRGSTVRHYLDPATGTWRTYEHPYAVDPWPANYGFLPGTHNPADGDALDVLILAGPALPTGTQVRVRPVGLLERPDGDHKVIAVVVADPIYGDLRWLSEVPEEDRLVIERWFRAWGPVGVWRDAAAAEQLIHQSREPQTA